MATNRSSRKTVEAVLDLIRVQLVREGRATLAARLQIAGGSPTYGRAWRLYALDATNGGHYGADIGEGGNGYIGWSAREAEQTLRTIFAARCAALRPADDRRELV